MTDKSRRSIVITHYCYKRLPQKRKAVALEVPVIVVAKVSTQPAAPKPTVVVSISRKRGRLLHSVAEEPREPSPEVNAFFARNVRPWGPRSPSKP